MMIIIMMIIIIIIIIIINNNNNPMVLNPIDGKPWLSTVGLSSTCRQTEIKDHEA